MTAIYGLWRLDDSDAATDFRRMDLALARYGGDGHETHRADTSLTIGRRLRRLLPEDRFPARDQPGRRYVVAGDVRLTEREDLARRLALGESAAQMSDAAIAAIAVETWDEAAFDRIYGDFALAAWDTRERRLLLARDHLGHKPLFFCSTDRLFAFASMPGGLHALPEVPRGADMQAMKRFLACQYHSAGGTTHYDGIARILPGHYAVVTPGRLVQTRYWNPDLTPLKLATHQDYVTALSQQLDRAVAAALRGAEPEVGAHLSAGFDSTAVATTAARCLAARGGRVVAYTAAPREGFEKRLPGDRMGDESSLASATAAMHANMEHVVIRSDRTPMANLARTASVYGTPVYGICNETWFDAINDAAARRGIRVMLEALMGNATLSEPGEWALHELMRSGRIVAWLKLVFDLLRKRAISVKAIAWDSFSPWLPKSAYRWVFELRHGPWVRTARFSPLKAEHFRTAVREAIDDSPIPRSRHCVLPSGYIRQTGRSVDYRLALLAADDGGASYKGMLDVWNIDYRDPTADRRLVEFSLRVPAEQLIHEGERRAILRKALADRAPPQLLDNLSKGLQAADWHEGLNQAHDEVVNEVGRIEMFGPSAEIIDVPRLKKLLDDWPDSGSGIWNSYEASIDYRYCLLRAISVAAFMRQAAGSNY